MPHGDATQPLICPNSILSLLENSFSYLRVPQDELSGRGWPGRIGLFGLSERVGEVLTVPPGLHHLTGLSGSKTSTRSHAALRWYSWMSPPRTSRRRTFVLGIVPGSDPAGHRELNSSSGLR